MLSSPARFRRGNARHPIRGVGNTSLLREDGASDQALRLCRGDGFMLVKGNNAGLCTSRDFNGLGTDWWLDGRERAQTALDLRGETMPAGASLLTSMAHL